MYEAYFGLQEKPFAITPDPRYLYLSKTHRDAMAHLLYGLRDRVGFIAITGEVGAGKTTTLRSFCAQLDEAAYRLALIFNPRLTPIGLLQSINGEFGLPGRRRSLVALVGELNDFLLEENRSGRTPVLIIDEAQSLSADVLEQIRLLSNLETERDKLIQIVLVGQPELADLLSRPNLRQLNQRIVVRCRLDPLDNPATGAYIQHRLKVAGRADGALFTPAALKEVYRHSRGLPRLINIICDRAMLVSYAGNQGQVRPRDVRQAAREVVGSGLPWRQSAGGDGILATIARWRRGLRRSSFGSR